MPASAERRQLDDGLSGLYPPGVGAGHWSSVVAEFERHSALYSTLREIIWALMKSSRSFQSKAGIVRSISACEPESELTECAGPSPKSWASTGISCGDLLLQAVRSFLHAQCKTPKLTIPLRMELQQSHYRNA